MAVPRAKEDEKLRAVESVTWEGLTWVNIERPTERETEYLAKHYPFHPLHLDDCLSRIQRPKIDESEDYIFIVLHFPVFHKEPRVTVPSQVSIFISENYLVTVHKGEFKPLTKLFDACQSDERALKENLGRSSGYLLYRIVDRLVDYCLPILDKIIDNMERVEEGIFDKVPRETVREISLLRRDIISYRRIIWPLRAVLGTLEPKTRRFVKEDMAEYFGDLLDHTDKIWDNLDECKEVIEGLSDTNNSLTSNRINEVMRVLTIIATIMMPLTVVSSIYGMNIGLPGGLDGGSSATFGVMIGIMVLIVGGMLFFFRRRRWI